MKYRCLTLLVAAFLSGTAGFLKGAPPTATDFTNTVDFDFTNNIFNFGYQGSDGTLTYHYAPGTGEYGENGSFHPLSCVVNGTNTFLPSYWGGLSMMTADAVEICPWGPGVWATMLNAQAVDNGNALLTQWEMKCETNGLNYHLIYNYRLQMTGRTLVIQVTTTNGTSGGVYLDRCENATAPSIICVPYLTMMNVLFADGVFCSMYFDWENTAASTISQLSRVSSASSAYFAPQAKYLPRTDGTRGNVNETIYLTVSPSLTDVLPNMPNPRSPYKDVMANHLVSDNWETGFATVNAQVQTLDGAGVSNLWVLVHKWQNGGYDNQYPNALPANPLLGGSNGLMEVSQTARASGYLFGLHENYADFYPNAALWNPNDCALNSDGTPKQAWFNWTTQIQSYEMKPALAANYLNYFAQQIHSDYETTASFLDECSSVNPSDKVDYDAGTTNAGTFHETLSRYRTLYGLLRAAHDGPVSGEGCNHMLSLGYIDDVEAQIDTGSESWVPATHGQWLPLLVDFDLLKLHDLTVTHGVGYYERFYADMNNTFQYANYPRAAVLEYMATELAFGHGGYIPTPGLVDDYVATAQLEERHVLPAQALYANATAVSILYHDSVSNDEVSASDYIRRHPATFASQSSTNFMSQVRVTYDNGVVVCVNRHPSRQWQVQLGQAGGWFNFNAVMNGTNVQWVGRTNVTSYLLPQTNGWVVFAPAALLTPP
jgi:hypothetical protein